MNDTMLLAKLVIAADVAHQASYVKSRSRRLGPSGELVIISGGYHDLSLDQALAGAIIELANGDDELVARLADLSVPAKLMFAYIGEAREWADAYVANHGKRNAELLLDAEIAQLI